jgi:hypothetical protein
MRLHDEKPPVADRPTSQAVDLVIWRPRDRDEHVLVELLKRHGFGERSQTVVWLDKFTVRLSMWRGRYLALLDADGWHDATAELVKFLEAVQAHYQPRRLELDTRAYTVGVERRSPRRRVPLSAVATLPHDVPVYWDVVASGRAG